MAADVSRDGQYALTSHRDNALVLWNLQTHEYRQLHDNANIYSAAFVQDSHQVLWQDLDNVVHVETIDGKELESFHHFPTYGHAMTRNRALYLSANQDWYLFAGRGGKRTPVLRDSDSPSFLGSHKLLNLTLSDSNNFLTAGAGPGGRGPIDAEHPPVRPEKEHPLFSEYKGVVLWSKRSLKPVAKFNGFDAKTHATLSPDGQWVVGADEAGKAYYWNTQKPEERHRFSSYALGIYLDDTPYELGDPRNWDDSGLIEPMAGVRDITLANAFIDHSDYFLRFGNNSHIAALFKTGNPWPQAYFDLGESPELVTYGSHYSRNTAIATSPQAGVLVIGHNDDGGISVYHFDGEKQTLKRIWVPGWD
ncbi:WD40 repeat domain-containing protein [Marinobacter halodurans]|uniref:WD40 repeat domain-containing protein n=1 Tax=Marinobacter halodurans TaxID=2528979 RepID=A0ABY1ZJG4_9GAMM|nr:WD40 repeat domain-containing protein [Marinobacter halodurans]TBW51308.1 WD40 repeat domain-containing protein [Marinobacter halodurans]